MHCCLFLFLSPRWWVATGSGRGWGHPPPSIPIAARRPGMESRAVLGSLRGWWRGVSCPVCCDRRWFRGRPNLGLPAGSAAPPGPATGASPGSGCGSGAARPGRCVFPSVGRISARTRCPVTAVGFGERQLLLERFHTRRGEKDAISNRVFLQEVYKPFYVKAKDLLSLGERGR